MLKQAFRDALTFSKKEKESYKEKCGTVEKIKSVSNVIIKVSHKSCSSMRKYSIR